MHELSREIGDLLRYQGMSLGVVESATGGLLSSLITDAPGSSDYYKGSVTAYHNDIKTEVVGVSAAVIREQCAVSSRVAEEMALGGCRVLTADICLADTGIAGPGGDTSEKPVGLFYLGLAHLGDAFSRKYEFSGDREQNKRDAALVALGWLKEYLESLDSGRAPVD